MKKLLAFVMVLALGLCMLTASAFAAEDYWCIAGSMNGWNTGSDRMTSNGNGIYTMTYDNLAAGDYEFKFTKNDTWDGCLGGAFMGSGVESSLSSPGNNIKFSLTEASQVVIQLDANNQNFTLTIGGQVAEGPNNITIHISVPDDWGAAYGYCWNPDSLGSWPGTVAADGKLVLPAVFDGFIVNNNNGRQTADINNIDLTKEEVWITVNSDNSYTLSYEDPDQGGAPVEPPVVSNIKIHVIAPDSWDAVYGYTFTPEQCGAWPGMLAENGVINTAASFGGFIVNNGAGAQTGDITDIDLTKEEVWVVVAEDCSYKLYYSEADVVIPQPIAKIKIHVIAEHWNTIYAYTFDPANCGAWPGSQLSDGYVEAPANFGGLVLNNGIGEQTADITDIDLSKAEVWITVHEDNSYEVSYSAPVIEDEPTGGQQPDTGDTLLVCSMILAMSVMGVFCVVTKKNM